MLISVLNIKLTCEWHKATKLNYKNTRTRVIVVLRVTNTIHEKALRWRNMADCAKRHAGTVSTAFHCQGRSHCHVTSKLCRLQYTGCPRRNVPDFGRVFLMLKYTDITQNTYISSWTVTEIMAREKWGLLAVPNTATCTADTSRDNASGLERRMQCSLCLRDTLRNQPCYVTAGFSHV